MEKADRVWAFNEWMRLYTEEPSKFEQMFETATRYLREVAEGKEPSYGEACDEFMTRLVAERA